MAELSQNYTLPFNEHNNPAMREIDLNDIKNQHPDFYGDLEHLNLFLKLAATPTHTLERGESLRQWKASNRVQQTNEQGLAIKGGVEFQGFDLRGADLHNIYLGYVDLRGARLDKANMEGTRMKGAWLDGASLVGTKLACSYFSFASFSGTNFTEADLTDANFSECKLIDANFSRATLTGSFLRDTQRRNWNLRDVNCECIYWDQATPPTQYSPGEFEELYSEDRVVQFAIDGKVDSFTVSSVPEIIRAFKEYHHTELTLVGIENINGVNRFRFTVDGGSSQSDSQIESKLDDLMQVLQTIKIQPRGDTNYNYHTEITGQVQQLFQAGQINPNSDTESSHIGVPDMAKFNNTIENSTIGQLNQADQINSPVYQEIHITQSDAQELLDVLESQTPEKKGFTEEMKQEVKSALLAVMKQEVKALAVKAYGLLKEFFPSYIKAILP